jgi:putative aminopeptidase FrvX
LLVKWDGENNDHPRALTAHMDTPGAMVKEIRSYGQFKLIKLCGYTWNTFEVEGVTVFITDGI